MNVKGFVQLLGCNVCLLEYRGYGHSDGSPHEEGLYLDAQAALEYLIGRPDVDQRKIIVFGRSLGESFYQTPWHFHTLLACRSIKLHTITRTTTR